LHETGRVGVIAGAWIQEISVVQSSRALSGYLVCQLIPNAISNTW
jgi:hypothetical protein